MFFKVFEKAAERYHIGVRSFDGNMFSMFIEATAKSFCEFYIYLRNFKGIRINIFIFKILSKFLQMTSILLYCFWRFIFSDFEPIKKVIFCEYKFHILDIFWMKIGILFYKILDWEKEFFSQIFYIIPIHPFPLLQFMWLHIHKLSLKNS